jgi:2-methylcitrate dehydratase PrpD
VTETRKLAEFCVDLELEKCPAAALIQAKRCVLETVGCSLGGARTPPMQAAIRSVQRLAEGGCATVVGRNMMAAPDRAAFLNGISANALDFDGGIVRQGHYGPTVISSAIAIGELVEAPGSRILSAIIAGYEVVARVGMALRATPQRRELVSGYGPYQGFGSVAAAGHLLRLTPDQMVHALGTYGAFAPVPSTKQCNWNNRPLSWTKDMVAWPSMSGINAALLAESGFLGPRSIFEGEKGFFRMAGSDHYVPELLVSGLGDDFKILGLYFKPYPCCRWIHAALEGVEQILQRKGWRAPDVAAVRVGVAQEVMDDLSDFEPRNLVDAEFSLPYGVAMVLLGLEPGPRWHDPQLLGSREVLGAMTKVSLHADAHMETLFNDQSIVGAAVQLTGRDGSIEQSRIETTFGDEKRPMSDSDLETKFMRLSAESIAKKSAETAISLIQDMEHLSSIARLTALLRA